MIAIQGLAVLGLAIGIRTVKAWSHSTPAEVSSLVSNADDPVLVAFVKPDEPSSAALEEEWTDDISHPRLSIDCTDHPTSCDEIQPSMTYPSIFLIQKDHQPVRYLGPLLSDSFDKFTKRYNRHRQTHRILTPISDLDSLQHFKHDDDISFILYLARPNPEILAAYEAVAGKYKLEFSFGVVSGVFELLEAEAVDPNSRGLLVCYRADEREGVRISLDKPEFGEDGRRLKEMERFVGKAPRGVLTELSPWNHQRLRDLGKPIVYLFAPTASARKELREQFSRFAKDYYYQFTSVLVDPHLFPDLMPRLGLLDKTSFPAGAVHILSENKVYPYPQGQEMTIAKLQMWGMKIWQGEVEPWTPGGKSSGDVKGGEENKGGSDSGIRLQGKVGTKRKVTVGGGGGGGWGKGKGKIPNIPGVKINIPGVRRDEL